MKEIYKKRNKGKNEKQRERKIHHGRQRGKI